MGLPDRLAAALAGRYRLSPRAANPCTRETQEETVRHTAGHRLMSTPVRSSDPLNARLHHPSRSFVNRALLLLFALAAAAPGLSAQTAPATPDLDSIFKPVIGARSARSAAGVRTLRPA